MSADLTGYEALVAVTGGIASYKSATLVSRLVQRGCGVTVAMSRSARRFITPLTLRALSGRAVYVSPWQVENPADQQHLRLTECADLFIVAPATANVIGKAAMGLADDLVTTLLLSRSGPVLMAPAMNTRMWENPIVRQNVTRLREVGIEFIGPGDGWMACRAVGIGRMSEPEEIAEQAAAMLRRLPPKSAARP